MILLALLVSAVPVLWHEPPPIQGADFSQSARSVPEPAAPFSFIREDLSGNSPKIIVRDSAGRIWQVKGGPEGRAEAFVTRIVSALGYYTDAVWFVPYGRIEDIGITLKRASGFVRKDGTFTYAAFELRETGSRFLADQDWTWLDNPFAGTPELKGLKILVMLVSDWDNKDGRDGMRGSNTALMDVTTGRGLLRYYYVDDWGQSMGAWGLYRGRSNWNCADYTRQTRDFITGVHGGRVMFGFGGQHTSDFSHDVTVQDVQWLMSRLGNLTDAQIGTALRASGASDAERECFTAALRRRIEALRRAAASR